MDRLEQQLIDVQSRLADIDIELENIKNEFIRDINVVNQEILKQVQQGVLGETNRASEAIVQLENVVRDFTEDTRARLNYTEVMCLSLIQQAVNDIPAKVTELVKEQITWSKIFKCLFSWRKR